MTTIAYRDGVLAADTLTTANGIRCGHHVKIHRFGRLLTGYCGRSSNYEAFRSWVKAGAEGKFTSAEGNVFIVTPDGVAIVWGDGDYPWRETGAMWALGSGEQLALGAMAAGATAEEAIHAAIAWDTGSGGPVTAIRL